MATPKIPISRVVNAINKKDVQFLSSLTPEELATVQPYLLQRWLYGSASDRQLMLLNEFVNGYIFPLQQHKQLLWDLLTVAGTPNANRLQWKPYAPKGKKGSTEHIIAQYHNVSIREARYLQSRYTDDDIEQMKNELGLSG